MKVNKMNLIAAVLSLSFSLSLSVASAAEFGAEPAGQCIMNQLPATTVTPDQVSGDWISYESNACHRSYKVGTVVSGPCAGRQAECVNTLACDTYPDDDQLYCNVLSR